MAVIRTPSGDRRQHLSGEGRTPSANLVVVFHRFTRIWGFNDFTVTAQSRTKGKPDSFAPWCAITRMVLLNVYGLRLGGSTSAR